MLILLLGHAFNLAIIKLYLHAMVEIKWKHRVEKNVNYFF